MPNRSIRHILSLLCFVFVIILFSNNAFSDSDTTGPELMISSLQFEKKVLEIDEDNTISAIITDPSGVISVEFYTNQNTIASISDDDEHFIGNILGLNIGRIQLEAVIATDSYCNSSLYVDMQYPEKYIPFSSFSNIYIVDFSKIYFDVVEEKGSFTLQDGQYVVHFHYFNDYAEIGHPFPMEYSVSGGSGTYSALYYGITYLSGTNSVLPESYHVEIVEASSGVFNMVAPAGVKAIIGFGGRDAVTGETFWVEDKNHITIKPNPDYPVVFSFDKQKYNAGDTVNIQYSINGLNAPLTEGTITWAIQKPRDPYMNVFEEMKVEEITSPNGSFSITPLYGTGFLLIIEGTTEDGYPLYAVSDLIPLNSESQSQYSDVSVTFKHELASAEIGHPFPVEYSVSGGSGTYSELYYGITYLSGTNFVLSEFDHIEIVEAPSGVFNMVAPAGVKAIIGFGGRDAVTGETFWVEDKNHITIKPNPDYPVVFSFDKQKYNAGDTVSVQYSINGLNAPLKEGTITWSIQRPLDPYMNLFDVMKVEEISSHNGSFSITPLYGTGFLFIIEGTTEDGYPLYAVSDLILLNENEDFSYLFLPASVQRIEAYAFEGVAANIIYIPSEITFIDDYAFYNSRIKVLVSRSNIVKDFAQRNGFTYVQADTIIKDFITQDS